MVSVPLERSDPHLRLGIDELDEGLGRGSYLLTKRTYWSLTWFYPLLLPKTKKRPANSGTEHQREKEIIRHQS